MSWISTTSKNSRKKLSDMMISSITIKPPAIDLNSKDPLLESLTGEEYMRLTRRTAGVTRRLFVSSVDRKTISKGIARLRNLTTRRKLPRTPPNSTRSL